MVDQILAFMFTSHWLETNTKQQAPAIAPLLRRLSELQLMAN